MKNLINLVIKMAFIYFVLFMMIPMLGKSTWTQTIVLGLIVGLLTYIIGDMWILPKFGNIAAVIGDLILAALVIWAIMKSLPQFVLTSGGVWAIALVLAVGEWLFHRYLLSSKAPNK